MPQWVTASRVFAAWSRRYRLNAPAQEILTGIIPVAEVDRHYTDDRLDLWGLFTQQLGTATPNRLGACSLVTQEKEALVHRVHVWIQTTGATLFVPYHLFTPLQAYDPHQFNPALVLPWLQPITSGVAGRLSRSFGLIGEQDFFQVVTVNGAPHTSIGPANPGFSAVTQPAPPTEIWTFQDPPIRLRPFTRVTVQSLVQIPAVGSLNVSFYYTERDDQGPVG